MCSVVHPDQATFAILQKIVNGHLPFGHVQDMQYLQHNIPIIYNIIIEEGRVEPFIITVIKELINISKRPFLTESHNLNNVQPHKLQDMSLSFYPRLPQLKERGSYLQDSKTLQAEFVGSKECEKLTQIIKRRGHSTLIPGLFTLLCPHGKQNITCSYAFTSHDMYTHNLIYLFN